MSYCVNCGVELDPSIEICPLCHTMVINPKEYNKLLQEPSYPTESGEVDIVKRKDMGIFTSIVLFSTAFGCFLLNTLVFNQSKWSYSIIGACILLFVLLMPVVVFRKMSAYLYILACGIATSIYLYLLTFLTQSDTWFHDIGLPTVGLLILLVELYTFLRKNFEISFITTALYVITELGIFCGFLEMLIDMHFHGKVQLYWSAIVLTVCAIIDVGLITVLSRRRLRETLRKRLHF